MAKSAILCLLATLCLFSGCLDSEAPTVEIVPDDSQAAAAQEPGAPDAAAPATPLAPPACPETSNRSNYGTWTQVGDEYIVSPYGGHLVVYYRESNGCSGLQIEDEWGHNPDTKVAEVPLPLLDGTAPPAKA